nr:hypothetical protein [Tanacetum cinerariifolium]
MLFLGYLPLEPLTDDNPTSDDHELIPVGLAHPVHKTALSAVPTSLSFQKVPVDKVPVLRVQHQSANKKQEFVKSDDKKVEKKADGKKKDMSIIKCYNCKKEGHFAKDRKKEKVKDYEYYKTKMLLSKKDKDKQVLLAKDQAWMESSSDSDQEINANMVFMAQIEKVLSDSKASSSSAGEKIFDVTYYLSESESESEFETLEYYDNSTNYGLFVNNDDDQEIFHDAIESASEHFIENHIDSQKDYDKSYVDHNDYEEKEHLVDKLIRKFNKKIVKCQNRVDKANQQSKDFENQNKDLQDKYDVLKNQTTTFEMNNNELNEQMKELIEKNNDLLAQTKDLQDKYDVLKNQTTTFEINNNELNEQMKELIEKNNDLLAQTKLLKEQLQVKHVVIDTHAECQEKYAKLRAERYEYMIRYSAYFDNDKQHKKHIANQQVLFDKISVQMVELDKHVRDLKNTVLEKDFQTSELEECVRNKDLEIEKCLERLNVCENKLHKMGQTNQTVYMIMPSKDNLYNGYTSMFLTHSDEAMEIEKFKRSRENKIEFAYDYGNLNASYVNEKINFKDDYFQEIINPDFEKIDSPFQHTSSLKPYVPNVILEKIIIDLEEEVVNILEKEKVNLETIESLKSKSFESSEKVIAPGTFKLNVSQCVSSISISKSSCDSNNDEIKLKRKRRKRKSSKENVKQVDNDVSRANNDFVHFSDLDTFSSVRRPKNSGVVWKKKGSSNTSNVYLSAVSVLSLNKIVKRYSRKDLLACNNSHLGETRSTFVCNDAMNVSCDSRMNDLLDDNNFLIFDDVNVRISPVSKMPFKKKPRDSMHVHSKSNMIKSLPRTVHKWLPKM